MANAGSGFRAVQVASVILNLLARHGLKAVGGVQPTRRSLPEWQTKSIRVN